MRLGAIILAAGKSTRMQSARPKPLQEICGRPMLEYVLRACEGAGCEQLMVVVGYGKDEVLAAFSEKGRSRRIHWVEQTEQLGTGHAARMCEEELKKYPDADIFILAGDGPLIRDEVLRTLLSVHREEHAAATMATAMLEDPTGYGRIIRDEKTGEFRTIVEQADGTPDQLAIREVFPSYYCVKANELLHAMKKIKNDNRKGEYYLTDIFGILRQENKKIVAVQAVSAEDILSINTRIQQAEVDAVMQDRIQHRLRESGVTIVSSGGTYIESGATVGQDTVIQPFSFIGRDSRIGRNCVIGPFAVVPRDGVVSDGTTVAGNLSADAFGASGG